MGWDLTADASCGSFHIAMTCRDFVPVQSPWILEGQMVFMDGGEPGIYDSATTIRGRSGSMDDLWTSEAEAISGARTRNGVTPVLTILLAILGVAIGGGAGRVVASVDPSLMPLVDMLVEAGDDEGACLIIFGVEGYAAGKDVGSTTGGDVLSHVEI